MGNNRPVKTKHWVKYLEHRGCKYRRTRASHYHYKCPNCIRTITHRENEKEIPPDHLRSNLQTLNSTLQELYQWIEENC